MNHTTSLTANSYTESSTFFFFIHLHVSETLSDRWTADFNFVPQAKQAEVHAWIAAEKYFSYVREKHRPADVCLLASQILLKKLRNVNEQFNTDKNRQVNRTWCYQCNNFRNVSSRPHRSHRPTDPQRRTFNLIMCSFTPSHLSH